MGLTPHIHFLLDTNVVIGLLKGTELSINLLLRREILLEHCSVSLITRIELLGFPGIKPAEEVKVAAMLARLEILPLDEEVEAITIDLRRRTRMKLPDAIIGATALANGLELLTFDERLKAGLQRPH